MPKLPTAENLGYIAPSPASHTVHVPDLSGKAKGLGTLGQTLEHIGAEMAEKQNAVELIKAEAEHQKGLGEIHRQLYSDSDIASHPEKFNSAAQQLTDRTTSMLSNPHAQKLWEGRAGMHNETARNSLFSHNQQLQKQWQQIDLEDALETHRTTLASPDATKTQRDMALRSVDDAVDVATKTGIVPPLRAQRLKQKVYQQADEYQVQNRIKRGDLGVTQDIWGGKGPSTKAESFSPEVNSAINDAATQNGVDPKTMELYAKWESGGNPKARTGSYGGLFQLSKSEFVGHGGAGDIYDAGENANAAARKLAEESRAFEEKHGAPPTVADLYLIHNQGSGGYEAHRANPSELAWKNMLSTAEGKQKGEEWAKAAIIGNMTPEMKKKYGSDVDRITSQDFVDGWKERAEKEGAAPDASGSPYKHLTPAQRSKLTHEAKSAFRTHADEDLKNGLAEILRTGRASVDEKGRTALDRAMLVLSDNEKAKAQEHWAEANLTYEAQGQFDRLSIGKARDNLSQIIPSPDDEHYAMRWRVYDNSIKKLEAREKMRNADPVHAVSRHPDVTATEKVIQGAALPQAKAGELRIDARLSAQANVEIPQGERRILTNQEVRDLLQMPPHPTEDDIDKAMPSISQRAHALYGRYAVQAAREAVHKGIPGQTNRERAEEQIEDLDKKPAQQKKSRGWFDSEEKVPTKEEVAFAKAHPEIQPHFDQKYGSGAYARMMEQEQKK